MSTLAFLPWAAFQREDRFAEFTLHPYRRKWATERKQHPLDSPKTLDELNITTCYLTEQGA